MQTRTDSFCLKFTIKIFEKHMMSKYKLSNGLSNKL